MRLTRLVLIGIGVVTVVIAGWLVSGRQNSVATANNRLAANPAAAPPVPVNAVTVTAQDVPIIIPALGTVQPFNRVEVKSRVDGQIIKVNFSEGQHVKIGDPLIEIDPRPYQASLDQTKAGLARDEALLDNAERDLARYTALLKNEFASRQSYDTQRAQVAQYQAAIKGDQAMIKANQLNIGYSHIISPIDGRIGIRAVDIGNFVNASAGTSLVTVTQTQPIYVNLTLPQENLPAVREASTRGPVSVDVYDQDDKVLLARGALAVIDNQVDTTTGTVKLRAQFANQDEALWPGAFVNGHITTDIIKSGIIVPAAAVEVGPEGRFVFVIAGNMTVAVRPVKIGQERNNVALIESGLQSGEQIVVAGQLRLRPGAHVTIAPTALAPPGTGAQPISAATTGQGQAELNGRSAATGTASATAAAQ